MSRRRDLEARVEEVARALWAGEASEHLVGDLEALARDARPGGEAWQFAHRHLAAILATSDPWRASVLARQLVATCPYDHAGWAALGLAQSLLGNVRFAVRCYERATRLAPEQGRYAHNLGHLYDVALDRVGDALPLLERAHRADPRCPHVAASFAHALGRAGRAREGLRVLRAALQRGRTRDQAEVLAWLEAEVAREPEPTEPPQTEGSGAANRPRRGRAPRRKPGSA